MTSLYSKNWLFTWILIFAVSCAYAQPSNDECGNAIPIPEVQNWCSDNAAFTNVGATPSGFGPPLCFGSTQNDVWFSFVAISTDLIVLVKGAINPAPGGTLNNPQVSLYFGDCNGTINTIGCVSSTGSDIIELYEGGMLVGQTYYIRVQGASGNMGTFQLCVDNFSLPVQPGSDCISAAVLCDKEPFVVQQVSGAGNDPNEAGNSSCLGSFGGNSESNSTWFNWIAANDGSLTFTLSPLNISDDLDFVLYELPSGVQNCNDKLELRCMASGELAEFFPSPCLGPTGLRVGETDFSEPGGCDDPTQNSFVAPIEMEAGKAYALMVNNFSGTGNGFSIEFGGTGEFAGPQTFITTEPSDICYGEQMTIGEVSSFSAIAINSWQWNFGLGATPAVASTKGPHVVSWNSPGPKSIVLTAGTELGCQVTIIRTIVVDPCCETLNGLDVQAQLTELLCPSIPDGAIDLSVSSNAPGYTYEWSTNETTEDINSLGLGDYQVTVTNAATCDTVVTYTIGAPFGINVETQITMPQCMNGMDGAIVLNVTGGVPPYQYDWGSGFVNDNSLLNIGVGIYDVIVQDANDCQEILSLDVRELELVLDANIPVVTAPSCFDSFDGSVAFIVANGTPPYLFDFNDGNGFVSTNTKTGLNSGTFNITFQDASGCFGDTIVTVVPPTPVVIMTNVTNVSCFGEGDGFVEALVSGGVGNYTYQWSDPAMQSDSIANELVPGQYTVAVADGNACMATATINITEPAELFLNILGVEDALCFGDTTGIINVLGAGGNPGYEYSADGINFQTDTSLQNLSAGAYEVFVLDQLGCMASAFATISEPAELIVDAGRDTTVELGFPVRLNPISFPFFRPVTYNWSPINDLECTDCPRVEVIAPNTITYEVLITDETGCTARDSVTISVVKNRPIYIPNAFSPNADGVNDYFTAYGNPAAFRIAQMSIFDRWGGLVFEKRDFPLNVESIGWDGTCQGELMPIDVFVYYIVIEFIDQEQVEFEGDITIIK